MAEITTVTFDLWQTLLLDNRESGLARTKVRLEGTRQALSRFGEEYELEHIREAYQDCFQQCRQVREQYMDVSFREQVEIFVNNINPELVSRLDADTLKEIMRVYADSFLIQPPVLHADALAVLRDLRATGLRIGLISNTGMTPGFTFRDFMRQKGMLEYFDTLTFSDEVRLAKPGNAIFQMTLRAMGVSPDQTVHVGDHVINDVLGAKRAGMKTVWITGFSEREDPSDPETEPDATVADLGMVYRAIAEMSGRHLPG